MLQHKLSLAMAIVTAALVTFLPFVPNISPSLTAAIVGFLGTVTTTIAKFQTPPGAKTEGDKPKDPPMGGAAVGLAILAVVLLLPGCSRFMHFSDPTLDDGVTDLCSTLALQERPKLEAEAKRQGVSLVVLQDIFEAACALRVKQGLSPARAAGMAAARHETDSDAGAP